jgi:branched-chain amino acid transport system substrate-binding protein
VNPYSPAKSLSPARLTALLLIVLLTATLLSFLLVTGRGQAAPAATTVIIGMASDQSGPAQSVGWPQANAVQLAVDEINAAGGIDVGGMLVTVTLVTADSGCNPGQATTAVTNLLAAGATAIVGTTCSGAALAVQPLVQAAGVTLISPSATDPQVTEGGYTTTFRVISRDDAPPISLAYYFSERAVLDRAAIVSLNNEYQFADDAFDSAFTSVGGTITSRRVAADPSQFAAVLALIQPENPDLIFYADYSAANAGQLSLEAHNLGMTDVIMAWNTFDYNLDLLDAYATAAGAAVEGDHLGMYYRHPNYMPGYEDFNAAYQATGFPNYGDEADAWGAFGYDAARIIFAAIDRANSVNPADIRDEIAATVDFNGVVGGYTGFDSKGDVIPQWSWIEWRIGGVWVWIGGGGSIKLPSVFLDAN